MPKKGVDLSVFTGLGVKYKWDIDLPDFSDKADGKMHKEIDLTPYQPAIEIFRKFIMVFVCLGFWYGVTHEIRNASAN